MKQLLEALYEMNKERQSDSFEKLLDIYSNDWPGLASVLIGTLNIDEFVGQIDRIIHGNIPRKDSYGRLCKGLLDQAPTLKAVICFSTELHKKTITSWTFKRNGKIGIVISPNYDFFFGAGWTRYQGFKKQWKVQTPFSEKSPNPIQRTIDYIHEYVPYKLSKKKNLVLTCKNYEDAYEDEGFAIRTLRKAINEYNLIFLGTSFTDEPLNNILKQYKGRRRHFIIDKASTEAIQRAKQLNVCTIEVGCYSEIANVLKQIYCAALSAKKCQMVNIDSSEKYWQRLEEGPVKSRK